MSKTTPVRWWRDDATRYVTRGPHGPQTVPSARVDASWAFELISGPIDPVLLRIRDQLLALDRAIAGAFTMPPELLHCGGTSYGLCSGVALDERRRRIG